MDKDNKYIYQTPMARHPALQAFSRQVHLARSGLNLFAYDTGAGSTTPWVMVHGLGDEADTWHSILPEVAKENRAIAPDLPGFGRSDKPDRAYTIHFYIETILELLDTLEIPRANLLGHSLGGMICQAFTLAYPDRVERLGLVSGSLVARVQKIDLATLMFIVPGVGEYLYNRLRKDPQAAYRTLEPYYFNLAGMPEAERNFLYQRVNQRVWSDGQRRAFLSTMRSLARWLPTQQKMLPEHLAMLETPTRVVWGESDRVNSIENGRALVEMQSSARLVALPGSGHNLQQENPIALLQALKT